MSVAQGGLATAAYHAQTRRAVARARRAHGVDAAAAALGRRAPRLTPGSVAVHVMTSVLVFALLAVVAGLAVPHYHDRSLFYRATMKSDLRNLVTAQEGYFQDSLRYAGSAASLALVVTEGVTVEVGFASAEGFHAVARHASEPRYTCEIWVGAVPDRRPDTVEGVPSCHAD
jgi:ABC-type Fe3+ transport system permease subunit